MTWGQYLNRATVVGAVLEAMLASEIKLKLELSPNAVEQLLASDLLGQPASIQTQLATYFDTDDRRLFRRGFTLRIRRTGDVRIQTVKADGASASLFARSEWETPAAGETPTLDHANPIRSEFGSDIVLSPVFRIDVERRVWLIEQSGSKIEVALDQGSALSGDRYAPFHEIELELKDGERKDLFALARRIAEIVPIRFGVLSKAERGFSLLDEQRSSYRAQALHIDKTMRAAAAFPVIAASCFRQFRLNEDAFLAHRDAEALHQARVAIRRLRSALTFFKPLLEGGEPDRLKDELRWLADVLGEARNLDILLASTRDPDLRDRLSRAREATYDAAAETLASPRAGALMLDFSEWLYCGQAPGHPDMEKQQKTPAPEFAAAVLDRLRKTLKKRGASLDALDDDQRHDVRKCAKKLRYAAEFFGVLFDGKKETRRRKRFLEAMEAVQDRLGALNDLATGPAILEKHGLSDHPARESALSRADRQKLIDAAQAAIDDVIEAKRFWR